MKKVLSVLLAAAMVAGMSVSSFAAANDKEWGKGPASVQNTANVELLYFNDWMVVEHEDGTADSVNCNKTLEDKYTFRAGDVLWFTIMDTMGTETTSDDVSYKGDIDADWTINIKSNDYVTSAEFAVLHPATESLSDTTSVKYVKVTLDAEYDEIEDDDVDFYFYIADNDKDHWVGGKRTISAKGEVHYLFDNWDINYVEFDYINDVDHAANWEVAKGDKGVATFSFENEAYFVVKMVSEEKVVLNFETLDYVKAIEKAFDYEADYTTYNFKGTKDEFVRTGELVIPADEDSFIYAWDGEALVEIEATYVEDYKFDNGKKVDGWMIETNELGYYVVSDVEIEIEAEEVETEVEAEKANPETGAADFVGAAVAMAVVSVAAAGALALKK